MKHYSAVKLAVKPIAEKGNIMGTIFKAIHYGTYTTIAATLVLSLGSLLAHADGPAGSKGDQAAKFRQLGTDLPTANVYRSASGAPGPSYWQQQADYKIDVVLDEDKRQIIASETITYTNNSPDSLNYLWVQLDQNRFKNTSLARLSETASTSGTRRSKSGAGDSFSYNALRRAQAFSDTKYGHQILSVVDTNGKKFDYTINDTMMRIDLPETLAPKSQIAFNIDWKFNIIDEEAVGGRGGYEYFPETDTYLYFLAQWFPRMAAYTDYTGWQHKQFLGRGEFTLEFGDYEVNITVPSDHIVSATGVLQNPRQVLSPKQRKRLDQATATKQVFVVTPKEALENEKNKAKDTKTWRFKAEHVRDFSFASSRKFIWDAMLHEQESEENPVVTVMSFYPNDAEPIWSKYSSQAVAHTMSVYSRFTFDFPYPVSQSVNTWDRGGMEYPMITFNGYRPSKDEKTEEITYSRAIKNSLIGVIIHEVGHNYFPMIVNSDERQWTWMDEGLNSFVEYLAEYEWEEEFNISGGSANPLDTISTYMSSSNQVPIMTQSDSVLKFGPNAYSKPAAALTVLRETVLGRKLFDHAFKEYAVRWKFKRPTPADFFRTMEDASGTDLDWFFRGWFFGTDHVDVAINTIREYTISSQDPDIEFGKNRDEYWRDHPESITQIRNRKEGRKTRVERIESINDLYNDKDKYTVTNKDKNAHKEFLESLKDWERTAYERALEDGQYFYFVDFENVGGLVTSLPLTIHYVNGETEDLMIPAEIWRRNPENITKLLIRNKQIKSIDVDNLHQTADADYSNNSYPQKVSQSRFELYKNKRKSKSLMADMLVELKSDEDSKTESESGKSVPLKSSKPNAHQKETDRLTDEEKRALKRALKKLMQKN
ncbi:MAG: M1 family metallopeptidase [Robiginitomaculum sp.]